MQWVIEVGGNLISYDYKKSIENIKTRIKMISKEDTVVAERSNTELEGKIGIFQAIDQPEEGLSTAQLNDLIDNMLEEKSTPERSLSIEAMGIISVISGIGVYIIIPELGLSRTFYVDSDTHTFKDNLHTMTLTLNYASDVEKTENTDQSSHQIGDIVQFNGGYHYASSVADNPAGVECEPGPAEITLIANGAKHPWHLIHTDSSSRVYGWVDDGSFS